MIQQHRSAGKTRSTTGTVIVVSFEEAARILGGDKPVSVRHVERLCAERKLRRVGQNKGRRVLLDSIYAYLEEAAR